MTDWTDGLREFSPFLSSFSGGFTARLSEHWQSNTYSLHHTNGNQLGGNCSLWPLSRLHHIPSPLRPYILHTPTIKMSLRQSIHFIRQAFSMKLSKTNVIYFNRPDKIGEANERQTGEKKGGGGGVLTNAPERDSEWRTGHFKEALRSCHLRPVFFWSFWVGDAWSDG